MKRRNFIAGLVGAAASWPFSVAAQRSQRNVPLVGVISIGTASGQIPVRLREALLRGLHENGYSEGQNITIEERYFGNEPGRLGNAAEACWAWRGCDLGAGYSSRHCSQKSYQFDP